MRFRRLRTRLAVLYAGLFAVTLAGLAVAVFAVVASNAAGSVRRELTASGTVFDRLWAMRTDQLQGAARLLARDFGFREAVATGDAATTRSALDNLKARLGIRTAFIVGIDGEVVGLAGPAQADAARLWQALDSGRTAGVVRLGGRLMHAVAAPVMAPTLTGWVVFAADLGPPEMRALERLSAIPLSAAVTPPAGHELIGRPYVADGAIVLAKPLPGFDTNAPALLTLRYPMALVLASYRPLQYAMGLSALVGLALLLAGSWRLAQSITRPIAALDHAARKLERGEFVAVDVVAGDEIGRLAATFNRMLAGIAERERRITHLAFNDPLTGLPNRALFHEQLDYALRQSASRGLGPSVLCLDLDNFKAVNDTLGHPVGDRLLCIIADRLRHVAEGAFVARLGGDEFALVVGGDRDPGEAEALARRIIDTVADPVVIDRQQMAVGASVGIAVGPTDGADGDALLQNADLALYRAKAEGRGTYRFFETAMNARAQVRRGLEMDLRHALERGELMLFYQPMFGLATGEICGFEALMRWRHPTRGLVQPDDFIRITEETGLIIPIGEWAIAEACRQARDWPADIRIAVNVSAVQFRSPGLGDAIADAIDASGIVPSQLEIEITESVFLDGTEATLALLHSLRALGVRIALDDFGTGYSSLSYLRSFPFDKIKIDRTFITELSHSDSAGAIVHAIAGLANALGMETTAEGVEDEVQLDMLRRHGCSSVQGYLFSKPVPADELAVLIDRHTGPDLRRSRRARRAVGDILHG